MVTKNNNKIKIQKGGGFFLFLLRLFLNWKTWLIIVLIVLIVLLVYFFIIKEEETTDTTSDQYTKGEEGGEGDNEIFCTLNDQLKKLGYLWKPTKKNEIAPHLSCPGNSTTNELGEQNGMVYECTKNENNEGIFKLNRNNCFEKCDNNTNPPISAEINNKEMNINEIFTKECDYGTEGYISYECARDDTSMGSKINEVHKSQIKKTINCFKKCIPFNNYANMNNIYISNDNFHKSMTFDSDHTFTYKLNCDISKNIWGINEFVCNNGKWENTKSCDEVCNYNSDDVLGKRNILESDLPPGQDDFFNHCHKKNEDTDKYNNYSCHQNATTSNSKKIDNAKISKTVLKYFKDNSTFPPVGEFDIDICEEGTGTSKVKCELVGDTGYISIINKNNCHNDCYAVLGNPDPEGKRKHNDEWSIHCSNIPDNNYIDGNAIFKCINGNIEEDMSNCTN